MTNLLNRRIELRIRTDNFHDSNRRWEESIATWLTIFDLKVIQLFYLIALFIFLMGIIDACMYYGMAYDIASANCYNGIRNILHERSFNLPIYNQSIDNSIKTFMNNTIINYIEP